MLRVVFAEGYDSDRPNNSTQIGYKFSIFWPVWHRNYMDDLEKHLGFCTTSIFVHNFKAIGQFKLGLQYVKIQFGSNWTFCFLSRVTKKFERWPWKTIGHLFYATSSFVNHSNSFHYDTITETLWKRCHVQTGIRQTDTHWGHWWRRLQPTSSIITDAKSIQTRRFW